MKVRMTMRMCCAILLAALLASAGSGPVNAQGQNPTQPATNEHAVSASELHQDVHKAAETRRANEDGLRQLFTSDAAKEKLKSAGIDYKQVVQAIPQLSDDDLARLTQRTQEVRKDFAGGVLGDRDLLLILLVAVLIILIIVAVR